MADIENMREATDGMGFMPRSTDTGARIMARAVGRAINAKLADIRAENKRLMRQAEDQAEIIGGLIAQVETLRATKLSCAHERPMATCDLFVEIAHLSAEVERLRTETYELQAALSAALSDPPAAHAPDPLELLDHECSKAVAQSDEEGNDPYWQGQRDFAVTMRAAIALARKGKL